MAGSPGEQQLALFASGDLGSLWRSTKTNADSGHRSIGILEHKLKLVGMRHLGSDAA